MPSTATSHRMSVIIVDDHPVVRGGLEAMLRSEGTFHIIACVASGQEALEACLRLGMPEVVLMDIRMPECDGFQTLTILRRHFPTIRVLMLAGIPLKHEVERARELGACGYLSKSSDQLSILAALRSVQAGDSAFMQHDGRSARKGHMLSDREVEVLEHLARGLSREDIATALRISAETVKSHVKSILSKLHAADRTEAVARAYEMGLLRV